MDDLARKLGLVVVISAGNYLPGLHSREPSVINDYPAAMLSDDLAGLLNPASAALALTVGALCTDESLGALPANDSIDRQPLGAAGHPSPASRVGPGPMHMVKPELCAPGGGYSYHHGMGRLDERDASTHVVGADGARPDRLLATGVGTSYAAPLVSHAAVRVLGAYPELTANGVRALLLASAVPTPRVVVGDGVPAQQQQARLTGFGRVSAERAVTSDDYRAVLLAEEAVQLDDVHVFAVPVPRSFRESGGWRRITITLAYDPPVRATRLDYLANRMVFWAFLGASVDQVRVAYAKPSEGDDQVPEDLKNARVDLQPADRSHGAHQWGSHRFAQRLKAHQDPLVIVVRNTNRWDTPGATQAYALAVVLEREAWRTPLYDELRARFELLTEQEIELD